MNNDWEKGVPTLAGLERKSPFSVPERYFDNLQEQLNSRISVENVYSDRFDSKFTVPEGYFTELSAQIEGRIIADKLKESFVGNSFTVPEGYFAALQSRINEKVAEPAKVFSMRKSSVPAWLNYAAAACITIALSAGLIFNIQQSKTTPSPAKNTSTKVSTSAISNVSDETILDYLRLHTTRADMPAIIENIGSVSYTVDENIQSEDLQSYLDERAL
jgi:hypothetical protein